MMARVLALLALFHSAAAEASCVHVQNHAYGKECAAWPDGMYYKTSEMHDGKPIWQRGHGHVPEWGDMVRRPLPPAAPAPCRREILPGARPTGCSCHSCSATSARGAPPMLRLTAPACRRRTRCGSCTTRTTTTGGSRRTRSMGVRTQPLLASSSALHTVDALTQKQAAARRAPRTETAPTLRSRAAFSRARSACRTTTAKAAACVATPGIFVRSSRR